jgi:glyoxylase-like metal-dependent hydrolase (beta-lactamase superfamily II)
MTGEGNWTWLLRGRVPTLVDAGTGEVAHLAAVEAALAGSALAQIVVTHAHTDHISGAPALAARYPQARLLKRPWPGRDDRWPARWEPLDDGAEIDAGDTSLVAVHTPGHAPDHLSFWHAESRTLFCGDLVVKGSTVYIPSRLQGDLAAYIASLRRVLEMDPARLLPAHGPSIEDPAPVLRAHIEHRLEREAQIVEALRAGCSEPDAMVARVYRRLDPRLAPLARETVEAHLLKLLHEGRARRDGEAWHMMEP